MRTLAILTVLLAVTSASADPAADRAAADALFKQARDLVKQGKFAEACPKFEASLQLDDAAGTVLNLADCYEQLGRTASAWSRFNEAAERFRADQDDRLPYTRKRIAALEPRLAWLTVHVGPAARVSGLKITRNGSPVIEAVFETKIPVDPGTYVLVATADGHNPVTKRIFLPQTGGSEVVSFDSLDEPPPTPEMPAKPPTPPAVTTRPTPPAPPARRETAPSPAAVAPAADTQIHETGEHPARFSPRQKLGLAIGAAGVVGLGTSVVLGLQARSKWNESDKFCNGDLCNAQGKQLADAAKSRANAATAVFVVGAALVGGGVATYLLAPKSHGAVVTPTASPESAGVLVTGSF